MDKTLFGDPVVSDGETTIFGDPVLSRNETGPAIAETPEYRADLAALRQRMNPPLRPTIPAEFGGGEDVPYPPMNQPLVDPRNLVGTRGPLLGALTRAVPQLNPYINALQRGSAETVAGLTTPSSLAQTPAFFVPYLGQALALKVGTEALSGAAGTVAGNPTAITALEQAPQAALGAAALLGGGVKTLERPAGPLFEGQVPPGARNVTPQAPPQLRGPTLALTAPERHFQVAPSEVPSPYGPLPPAPAVQNIMQLSPGELREYQREAQAIMTMQERQAADVASKTREAVDIPLVGGFTIPLRTIEQLRAELSGQTTPTLLPQIISPTGPVGTPAERPGGGPATGGQVSFAGQGVPSARQAAEFPKVGGEQEELMRGQFVPTGEKGGEENASRIRSNQGQVPVPTGQEGETQIQREGREAYSGENLQQPTPGQAESVGAREIRTRRLGPSGIFYGTDVAGGNEITLPRQGPGVKTYEGPWEHEGTGQGAPVADAVDTGVIQLPPDVQRLVSGKLGDPTWDTDLAGLIALKEQGVNVAHFVDPATPGKVVSVDLRNFDVVRARAELTQNVKGGEQSAEKTQKEQTLPQGAVAKTPAEEGTTVPSESKIIPVETAAPPNAEAKRVGEIITRLGEPDLTATEKQSLVDELVAMRKPAAKKGIKPTINPRGGEAGGPGFTQAVTDLVEEGKKALHNIILGPTAKGVPVGEALTARGLQLRGTSAPRTSAASEELGNKLVRFASAKVAGQIQGKITAPSDPAAQAQVAKDYEKTAFQNLLAQYVKSGVGIIGKRGMARPNIGGEPAGRIIVERYGGRYDLWLRKDLLPELRQALQPDSALSHGALAELGSLITKAQVSLGVDAVWHSVNVASGVDTAVRAALGKNVFGVREVDTITRVAKNVVNVMQDNPAIQQAVLELAKIGAWHDRPYIGSGIGLGAKIISVIDKAGRLSLNQIYDELVRSRVLTESEAGRREFVNRLGQYNVGLMSKPQQFFREMGISPFVVAGRNFNRQALKQLIGAPGVKGADFVEAAKLRARSFVGLLTGLVVVPVVANMLLTQEPFGRDGTPTGAIDTGKDNKEGNPIVIDPAKLLLVRRGMRITGLGALERDVRRGQVSGKTASTAMRDVINGLIHPWAGPAVDVVTVATTGHDISGYRQAVNPKDLGSRMAAAAREINPLAGGVAKGLQEGNVPGEVTKSFSGAIGVKSVPLSWEERLNQTAVRLTGKEYKDLKVRDRVKVMQEVRKFRSQRTEMQREASEELALEIDQENRRKLEGSLPKEQIQWLKDNQLILRGFRTSHVVGGTVVPFAREEREFYQKEVAQQYQSLIEKLMKRSNVKQETLDEYLEMGRARTLSKLERQYRK